VAEPTYKIEVECQVCTAKTPGHNWGKRKAQAEGWFFTRDGKAYCPVHNPPWVAEWRARRVNSE
jgi:hypothetical protein